MMAEDIVDEYLSAEELRDRLYQSLRSRGFVNSIKKQIRSNLVSELQYSGHGSVYVAHREIPEQRSLLHSATNSLVAGHLRRCQYDYTFSVFLPECGLTPDKIMPASDLLQLLHVSPQSKLYRKLTSDDDQKANGFLWQLVSELCSLYSTSTADSSCQTYPMSAVALSPLDDKLITVDDLYSTKKAEMSRTGRAGVEERLMAYQKRLDERSRADVEFEIGRFRNKELSRMRLEERERLSEEMSARRTEMEKTYQSKSVALQERERNDSERVHREQEIQSREVYAQRQSLLEEIEIVRQRESEVRRQGETLERERSLTEDRFKAREEMAKKRELTLDKLEREYDVKLQNEMTKSRLEEHAKYVDRNRNMEIREVQLKENERRIKEDIDKVQSLKDDLRDKSARVNELETQQQEARHTDVTATRRNELLNAKLREMVDYGQLKEENAVMRHELETVKMRLSENMMLYEKERAKNEELLRMRERPNDTTFSLQRDIDSAREALIHQKTLTDQTKAAYETRLKEEVNRKAELANQLEQQTIQQRETNRELEDLRQQLMHARNALNSEVFRKGKQTRSQVDLDVTDDQFTALNDKPRRCVQPVVDVSSDESEPLIYPGHCGEACGGDSGMMDADVVAQAKYRLKSLDREAQNLQQAYEHFHFRMTNVHSLDNANQSVRKLKSSRTKVKENGGARQTGPRTPLASPIKGDDPPLSSTPYKTFRPRREHTADDSFHDLQNLSYDPPPVIPQSRIPPAVIGQKTHKGLHTTALDQPPRLMSPVQLNIPTKRVTMDDIQCLSREPVGDGRLMQVDDLEERPGSPEVKIIPGSESDSLPDTSHAADNKRSSKSHGANLTPPPVSTPNSTTTTTHSTPSSHTLGGTVVLASHPDLGEIVESSGVAEEWTQQAPSLDSLWKTSAARATATSQEPEQRDVYDGPRGAPDLTECQPDIPGGRDDHGGASVNEGIDPVMKEYMEKIQTGRLQVFQKETTAPKDITEPLPQDQSPSISEVSISEQIKSDAVDVDFDDW